MVTFKDIQEGETAEPSDGLDVGMRVGGGPGFSLGWLGGWESHSQEREHRKMGRSGGMRCRYRFQHVGSEQERRQFQLPGVLSLTASSVVLPLLSSSHLKALKCQSEGQGARPGKSQCPGADSDEPWPPCHLRVTPSDFCPRLSCRLQLFPAPPTLLPCSSQAGPLITNC